MQTASFELWKSVKSSAGAGMSCVCRREELGYGVNSRLQEISMHLIMSASRWQGTFSSLLSVKINHYTRKKRFLFFVVVVVFQ